MRISYSLTVCNEYSEIQRLIPFLLKHKQPQDEIVVLFDSKNGTDDVKEYLTLNSVNNEFIWHPYEFTGHFADMKNQLSAYCSGDYIFNIDADEIPHEMLMNNIHAIIEDNPVDVILLPRVNTVVGLTPEHIQKWAWKVNEQGWVNWPDYQMRVYRNDESIRWQNKVHETLIGHKTISNLPLMEELSIYHPKTIGRQEKQNNYYNTL